MTNRLIRTAIAALGCLVLLAFFAPLSLLVLDDYLASGGVDNVRCPKCWQTFRNRDLETMDIEEMRWAYDVCPHCGHKDNVLNFATAWGGKKR